MLDAERRVPFEERRGVSEVGFREAQQWRDTRDIGSDEAAVDHASARFGVREGRHDHEGVSVSDEVALARVVVVGASAQEACAFVHLDDACDRVGAPGGVARETHEVAGHDGGTPEGTGAHGGHRAFVRGAFFSDGAPAATVDSHDTRGDGIGIGGAFLRAGSGAATIGARTHRGFIKILVVFEISCAPHHVFPAGLSVCSIEVHIPTKSGRVLFVVSTFTTRIPGTRSPMIAAAVAMRWSS